MRLQHRLEAGKQLLCTKIGAISSGIMVLTFPWAVGTVHSMLCCFATLSPTAATRPPAAGPNGNESCE